MSGIKSLARNLQDMGRGKDTILAHIMPEEAAMLKARGGRGTVNPNTGLLEFDNPSMGAYDAPSSTSSYDSYTGGSDLGGFSGSGNTTYSNASVGGGGSRDIGGTTTSPDMGGYLSVGGGGKDTSYYGGGTGSAFDLNGFVTGTSPMAIGGTGMGLGGSNASFGPSGVVQYGGGDGGNTGWASQYGSAAPAYTVTSQPDTFGVPTVVANAMQTMGTFFGSTLPNAASSVWDAMTNIPNVPDTRFNVQPQTLQQPGFGEGIPQSEIDKANAAGYLAGNFNDPYYGDTTAARTQYAASVPTAPTGDYLGYSYTPPSETSYIGSTTEPYRTELSDSMPAWMSSNEPLFDQAKFDQEMADFRTSIRAQLGEPEPIDGSEQGAEADRASSNDTAFAPFLGNPSPVVMGQGLDLGNQMVNNPLYSGGTYSDPTYSVDVPKMMSLVRSDPNAPTGVSFVGDRTIYDRAIPSLSDYGATFTPDTGGVDLTEDKNFVPPTGIATIPNPTDEASQRFFSHYGPALTQLSPGGFETQWGSSQFGNTPSMASEAQPQSFGSMYGLSVLNSLNADFEQQGQPAPSEQQAAPYTPNQYEKLAPNEVPLYGEAVPYSGPKGALPMTQEQRWTGGGLFNTLESMYNLPSGYLGKTYGIESDYGRDMGSPAGAYGPFQFVPSTGAKYGLMAEGQDTRSDLVASAEATARLAADNADTLTAALGRQPTSGELYLAHQQGAGTAAALLANPNAKAIDVLNNVWGNQDMAIKALVGNGGNLTMTAGEFANKWIQAASTKPTGDTGTQYAANVPTTPVTRSIRYQSVAEVPVEEIQQNPTVVSDVLENDFQSTFGGGSSNYGGTYRTPTKSSYSYPSNTGSETASVEPPAPPTPTTGINFTRRVYNPSDFAYVPTLSPAYS